MNITAEYVLCVVKDRLGIVCEDYFAIRTATANKLLVVFNVVDTCESMLFIAEQLTVFFESEHVLVWVNALFVYRIEADKMIAHLVGGIGKHKDDLLYALCDAAKTDRETVAAEDGEYDAHGLSAEFCLDI